MCHVSHVTRQILQTIFFIKKNKNQNQNLYFKKLQILFILKKIGQSGGANRWRFCYQRGLPRLVLLTSRVADPRRPKTPAQKCVHANLISLCKAAIF